MPRTTKAQRQIEKNTNTAQGIRQTSGKGKSNRVVNAGRVEAGKSGGFGTTTQKRQDIVQAFRDAGLSAD